MTWNVRGGIAKCIGNPILEKNSQFPYEKSISSSNFGLNGLKIGLWHHLGISFHLNAGIYKIFIFSRFLGIWRSNFCDFCDFCEKSELWLPINRQKLKILQILIFKWKLTPKWWHKPIFRPFGSKLEEKIDFSYENWLFFL